MDLETICDFMCAGNIKEIENAPCGLIVTRSDEALEEHSLKKLEFLDYICEKKKEILQNMDLS